MDTKLRNLERSDPVAYALSQHRVDPHWHCRWLRVAQFPLTVLGLETQGFYLSGYSKPRHLPNEIQVIPVAKRSVTYISKYKDWPPQEPTTRLEVKCYAPVLCEMVVFPEISNAVRDCAHFLARKIGELVTLTLIEVPHRMGARPWLKPVIKEENGLPQETHPERYIGGIL